MSDYPPSDPQNPYGQNPYGQQPPYGQGPYPGYPSMSPEDERTWSALAHFSGLIALVVSLGFLGPLLVLLVKGKESAKVRANAVEALNFQISWLLWSLVGGVVAVIGAVLTLGLGVFLIIPAAILWGVFWLAATIIAGIRGLNGEDYRYPLTLRFVS